MLCPVSVFATDVAGGETCDTNVLNTDTGPVNLRAEFEPETINLRWYNNNTLLDTTSTNSNDCTYDTPINLPANPTKPGYKFKGWKIRPEYDFSTLSTPNRIHRWVKHNSKCYYDDMSEVVECDDSFDDLNNGDWKMTFSFGTVYGIGIKSSTPGTSVGEIGNPSNNAGSYCWCMATGYIPNGSNIKYAPTNPHWVYRDTSPYCPNTCNYDEGVFRRSLFGQSDS